MAKERLQIKHDTEGHWKKAVNFIPLPGELIVYDGELDENKQYKVLPRFKIGDGKTKVNDLPFMKFGDDAKSKVSNGILEM